MRPCLVVSLLLLCGFAPGQLAIDYTLTVDPTEVKAGRFSVTLEVTGLPEGEVKVALPGWKPGAYRLVDWFKTIKNVSATTLEGAALDVKHPGERTWIVAPGHGGAMRLTYRQLTVRRSTSWMSLEGPATWMYLPDHIRAPCRVRFKLPGGWKIATGMTTTDDPAVFTAADYDTFADCPVELGELTIDEWEIGGKKHYLTYNQSPRLDRDAMRDMCTEIAEFQAKLFGEMPFDRYYFMWHLQRTQDFNGGLEHLNSTTLQIPEIAMLGSVRAMATLVAHEYFHLWNVKRIRPKLLGPFDYARPARVKGLWLSEGVTDYYAEVTCIRSGIWSSRRYLQSIVQHIAQLEQSRAYRRESVEDASFAAFDRQWMAGGLDYYNTGKLIGLLLDIEIRVRTKNDKSLDDVMRLLNERFALPKPGFEDGDVIKACSEVAGSDMAPWFKRYVSGKDALPFVDLLRAGGLDPSVVSVVHREALRSMMPEVKVENDGDESDPRWRVTQAATGGPFHVGDVVLRFGDHDARGPWSSRTFVGRNMRRAARRLPKDQKTIPVHVTRDGAEIELAVPVPLRIRIDRLRFADEVTPLQRAIRESMFIPE